MITVCQSCKQAMNVEGFKPGHIAMHEDCSNAAHAEKFAKLRMQNLRIKNAKLMKANRERKEKK